MFMPDRSITFMGTDYNSDAKMFAIPQVAFTSKINSDMSWGIMAYAMGGMNSDYRTTPDLNGLGIFFDSGRQTVDLSGMIVAPTVSFAMGKDVAVGVSLLIGYENLRFGNVYGMNNVAGAAATNEGSTMGYGAKLGVNAKISDGISVGAVLQPKISMGEIEFFKDFMSAASGGAFTGDAALTLPNIAGVGGKFAVGKNADIVADIMYYQWTSVDVFDFFGWEDQIVYKVGAEFRTSDKLALRAGFNYGKSPIQDDVALQNYPFPAVSEIHVTVGMGYKMDKNVTVDAYYLYSPESKIDDASGAGSISMTQNAFGLGINYAAK
jgi:long-chain fatty acid transport protein